MNAGLARHPELERCLATLLHWGTWLGCCIVGTGLVLQAAGGEGGLATRIVVAGIAVFLLLPVARVAVMLVVFLRERDYRFGLIAAAVLAIIVLGAVLGAHTAGTGAG
jgi:hypothetical protein